jgi:rhodanese-related sulfurtransferase
MPVSPQPIGRFTLSSWTAVELAHALGAGSAVVVLDVRHPTDYAADHLLAASSAPYETLEQIACVLVPHHRIDIVIDAGANPALGARCVELLTHLGYTNARYLAADAAQCLRHGVPRIDGMHAAAKLVGETAERALPTAIGADDLAARQHSGAPVVVIDTRTAEEFAVSHVPGALSCPGTELLYRIGDLVKDSSTTIVISCAGRHRGIVGAHTLREAEITNPVHYLDNGVTGWRISGRPVEQSQTTSTSVAPPSPTALRWSINAAEKLSAGIPRIGRAELDVLYEMAGAVPLYLLDVRTEAEFRRDHFPNASWAPGGQLIQETDAYIAARTATIVLLDDINAVRAAVTAHWLQRQGFDRIFIAAIHEPGADWDAVPAVGADTAAIAATVDASAVADQVTAGTIEIVDFAGSADFDRGHLPGARRLSRLALTGKLADRGESLPLLLTSPDGEIAASIAADLRRLYPGAAQHVRALRGGTDAWRRGGRTLTVDPSHPNRDEPPQDWGPPEDLAGTKVWFDNYLHWCASLSSRIDQSYGRDAS